MKLTLSPKENGGYIKKNRKTRKKTQVFCERGRATLIFTSGFLIYKRNS